ncbi:hypothetical protein TNCV_5062141 [Trichonephila clavipes]|nr:hypothetical protein TNCV_5062141 [Trichonephila clavipes]
MFSGNVCSENLSINNGEVTVLPSFMKVILLTASTPLEASFSSISESGKGIRPGQRLIDCACVAVSISKSPEGSFLIDFTESAEPCTALEIRKEDQFGGTSPRFSNQQWPWARAPRFAMQDPIQAPPGATRQARLYTS